MFHVRVCSPPNWLWFVTCCPSFHTFMHICRRKKNPVQLPRPIRWPCQAGVVRNSSFGKPSHGLDGLSVKKQIGKVWQISNSVIAGFTWESFIPEVHSILIMSKDIAALPVQAASQKNINHVFLKDPNWFLGRQISLSPQPFLSTSPAYGDLSS